MADVEMKEASASSSKGKAVAKGTDGASDKKKFEVKKVNLSSNLGGSPTLKTRTTQLRLYLVERSCPMGLGYRCRQLRHLPKPHYGLVYVSTGNRLR